MSACDLHIMSLFWERSHVSGTTVYKEGASPFVYSFKRFEFSNHVHTALLWPPCFPLPLSLVIKTKTWDVDSFHSHHTPVSPVTQSPVRRWGWRKGSLQFPTGQVMVTSSAFVRCPVPSKLAFRDSFRGPLKNQMWELSKLAMSGLKGGHKAMAIQTSCTN